MNCGLLIEVGLSRLAPISRRFQSMALAVALKDTWAKIEKKGK